MDNPKIPFIPEDTLRTQRVDIYLENLKDRLKQIRQQHDEVIHNSVEIIQEIDKVSSKLLVENKEWQFKESKRQEFQTKKEETHSKEPWVMANPISIRQILEKFEKLNESHLLGESLHLLRKAKESFDKIDILFGDDHSNQQRRLANLETKKSYKSDSMQEKIKIFNKPTEECKATTSKNSVIRSDTMENNAESIKENNVEINDVKEGTSCYVSCCSSCVSLQSSKTLEDVSNMAINKRSNSLIGYEGDIDDSEYDLLIFPKEKNR